MESGFGDENVARISALTWAKSVYEKRLRAAEAADNVKEASKYRFHLKRIARKLRAAINFVPGEPGRLPTPR